MKTHIQHNLPYPRPPTLLTFSSSPDLCLDYPSPRDPVDPYTSKENQVGCTGSRVGLSLGWILLHYQSENDDLHSYPVTVGDWSTVQCAPSTTTPTLRRTYHSSLS